MLLAIDIGNTNIMVGVFEGERLVARWRLATDARRMADQYALELRGMLLLKGPIAEDVDSVAICSVVPPLTATFVEAACTLFGVEPMVVGAGTRTGVPVLYDSPRDVGADRVVDAVAAKRLYGAPAVIVDFGTATVFDAIGRDGSYLGGAIAPGLSVAAESLYLSTSQLRRVEMVSPPVAIGRNTVHAIQSGLLLGYIGLVESMVGRFKAELEAPDATVVATGGLAHLLARDTRVIDVVDEDLTLRGLRFIYDLNDHRAGPS